MPDADTLIQHYLEGTLTDAEAEEAAHAAAKRAAARRKTAPALRDGRDAPRHEAARVPDKVIQPALVPKRRFTFATVTTVAAMAACIALAWARGWPCRG
jgi:hypothetical protein